MRDASGLPGGPSGRYRRGRGHSVCRPAGNEAPSNLTGGITFTMSKLSSTNDRITRASIRGGLSFKQAQNSLGTVGRPRRDKAAISFAQ
jgi:hypothetical protein